MFYTAKVTLLIGGSLSSHLELQLYSYQLFMKHKIFLRFVNIITMYGVKIDFVAAHYMI